MVYFALLKDKLHGDVAMRLSVSPFATSPTGFRDVAEMAYNLDVSRGNEQAMETGSSTGRNSAPKWTSSV